MDSYTPRGHCAFPDVKVILIEATSCSGLSDGLVHKV